MGDHLKANDALGLTQYITQCLEAEAATSYLLAVESLTIESWKEARDLLINTDSNRNRTTKEAFIKDIVTVFQGQVIDTKYIVGDLSILPGLSRSAVELAPYGNSIVYAVKQITEQTAKSVFENNCAANRTAAPLANSLSLVTSEGDSPNLNQRFYAGAVKNGRQRVTHNTRQEASNIANITKPTWTHGNLHSITEENQPPQLTFQCIGIKSGPKETPETLNKEFKNKWKGLQNLVIEPYSRTEYTTLFRVKFDMRRQ